MWRFDVKGVRGDFHFHTTNYRWIASPDDPGKENDFLYVTNILKPSGNKYHVERLIEDFEENKTWYDGRFHLKSSGKLFVFVTEFRERLTIRWVNNLEKELIL